MLCAERLRWVRALKRSSGAGARPALIQISAFTGMIMEVKDMALAQPRLKALVHTSRYALIAVLLGALLRTGPVSAACGPAAGSKNTACGAGALTHNTGTNGSAFGFNALLNNTSGGGNTASGVEALFSNTKGNTNTASGDSALRSNGTGNDNTAIGVKALFNNKSGNGNVAVGLGALGSNITGKFNIGIGAGAGSSIINTDSNIDIGTDGFSGDKNTLRVGEPTPGGQVRTFIAGIRGVTLGVGGEPVLIDDFNQLGTQISSSARYKRDIRDMGGASARLMQLRPVTFRYKNDPSGTLQYGLVAEEVVRVYPELVTRGRDGQLQSVRYQEFTALLLNELQKQTAKNVEQERELQKQSTNNTEQEREIRLLQRQITEIKQAMRTANPNRKLANASSVY